MRQCHKLLLLFFSFEIIIFFNLLLQSPSPSSRPRRVGTASFIAQAFNPRTREAERSSFKFKASQLPRETASKRKQNKKRKSFLHVWSTCLHLCVEAFAGVNRQLVREGASVFFFVCFLFCCCFCLFATARDLLECLDWHWHPHNLPFSHLILPKALF